jgi:diguanylate cyclase
VNVELKGEVKDRVLLEHQFAAALEQEEAARHMALHDSLTDLPNRALFDDRLAHGLAHAKRHGWQMAVMFIDLDDFKGINDAHGHDIGDRVLQIVGQRIASNTRSDDTVSRYGGDEFLFLLVEIQNEAAVPLVAQKIIEMVQAPCDVMVGDARLGVVIKASIGIAIYPNDGDTAALLMKKADTAMYQTKRDESGFSFPPREVLT